MKLSARAENILSRKYIMLCGWILMACFITRRLINHHALNNFLIFKYSFFHALHQQNLYNNYPECCFDSHHYGPLFSLLIAPFALLPLNLAIYLWQISIVVVLFVAINQLPLSNAKKTIICLFCTQELWLSLREFQTNAEIAAILILTWVLIENKKDFWAAFFIVLGFYVKLYGIVGLSFFFFSRNKVVLLSSVFFWGVVLFAAPMIVFSPKFIVQSYSDWYHILFVKNAQNTSITNIDQDISVMGMIRKVSRNANIATWPILATGLALFILPYFRTDKFNKRSFRLALLSSALIFTVLFSTSSERVTYIICFAGLGIWFVSGRTTWTTWQWVFFAAVLYFGSLFDVVSTRHYRIEIIKTYALKALPSMIAWLVIVFKMVTGPYHEKRAFTGSLLKRPQHYLYRLFNYER